jgi:hypothetical protein
VHRVAKVIAIYALWTTGFASAGQQPQKFSASFQVPRSDLANAEALATQLAALSPRVDRTEVKLLADCAYATVSQLRRQYHMFGTPIFNNFLIYHGLKKRGYCYQWSEDLLVALDALRLTSLELRWGEANPGNWRENNCLVVTAKGQPFRSGIRSGVSGRARVLDKSTAGRVVRCGWTHARRSVAHIWKARFLGGRCACV